MNEANPLTAGIEAYIDEYSSGKSSRQWIAIGLVMLDHLRRSCPLDPSGYLTRGGGEIANSRSGLAAVLESFRISPEFLNEATSRSNLKLGMRFAELINEGRALSSVPIELRLKLIDEAGEPLAILARHWLDRQAIRLALTPGDSPAGWIQELLKIGKNSRGKIEQHLVGAKLQRRHPQAPLDIHASHAADRQTGRSGDISIGTVIYHVTASPARSVIEKCLENARRGLQPVLVVPREKYHRALVLAQDSRADEKLTIAALEDFIAVNALEISQEEGVDITRVFVDIVNRYNLIIDKVESDPALRIDLK